MPETIILLKCSKCKLEKPTSEFRVRKNRLRGYQYWCKQCENIAGRSKKGREIKHRYRISAKGRKAEKNYQKSTKGKIVAIKMSKRYRNKFPKRWKAGQAVRNAVYAGKIAPITSRFCFCGNRAQHYHHFAGYAFEDYFHILALCAKCHRTFHINYLTANRGSQSCPLQ